MTESSKEYKLNKGRRVIDSCKTLEHLAVAWNYVDRMEDGVDLWQEVWDKKDLIIDEMIEKERQKQAEYRSLLITG